MDTRSITYEQPQQDVLESQKTAEWYIQNIRYYSSFYNRPFPKLYDTQDSALTLTPREAIFANNAYYDGTQRNLSYNYLSGAGSGVMQANWRNGQKIYTLVNNMVGTMTEILRHITPTTEAISERAKNDRTRLMDDLSLQIDAKEVLDQVKEMGVDFQPVNKNLEIADEQEAEFYAMQTYKDKAQYLGKDITDFLLKENRLLQKWAQKFRHCVISGITGVHNVVVNGRSSAEVIMPEEIVWDNSVEDDFNTNASFRGFIKMYTPVEIRKKWGKKLSTSDLTEIDKLSREASSTIDWIPTYNNASSFNWYDMNGDKKVNKVACVTMYWYTVRDTRYRERSVSRNEVSFSDVVEKINDTKQKNTVIPGDYGVVDICKGTLIGNRWLVEEGYVNNLVRDPSNKSNPRFPLFFFIPNMTQNRYRSIVGRLRELQDEADACGLKIRQLMGRDLGKNYLFRGSKLGMVQPKELFQDFKSMGISVVNDNSGEDQQLDKTDGQRVVEPVDLTLDPNVMRYAELKSLIQQEMEEIASIPKIALGQQTSVIGKGVQQETIQRSSLGNAALFNGFITHITMALQDEVNQQRFVFAAPGSERLAEMVVGERGLQFIKASENYLFEDLGVYMDLEDDVNDAVRMRLISYVQAWSQNPEFGVKPLDIIKLEKAKTFTEMTSILEYSLKKGELNAEQQRAYAQAQQQVQMEKEAQMQQAMGEQQQQQVVTKEDAATQRALIDADVKKGVAEQGNKTKLVQEAMAQGQPIE